MTAQPSNVVPLDVKPHPSFVTVTPDVATRWLAQNTHNRPLSAETVDRYARDMTSGRWHLDGNTIKFDLNGVLLDGQHRLCAVVKSGQSVTFLVVRGIAPQAIHSMDTGRARRLGQALGLLGYRNAHALGGTVRLFLAAEQDRLAEQRGSITISHDEALAFIADHPNIEDAVNWTATLHRRTDCPHAVVAYSFYRFAELSREDAESFWRSVADKVDLHTGDPVLALINRLAEFRRQRRTLVPREEYLSAIFRAWNARRDGKQLRMLRSYGPGGDLVPVPPLH